jgi:hypothetical protein
MRQQGYFPTNRAAELVAHGAEQGRAIQYLFVAEESNMVELVS